jgi:asparagine synthase (glutamine-hydrolysing)
MCGICGIYRPEGVTATDEQIVRRMMHLLKHRGPDGDGFWSSASGAVLGHRRLAIIDLATGDQPLFNETGDIGVILNGEIYNYRELRQELDALGHSFRTMSDTEVLVHGYEQWGNDLPTRLRGMFTFAIWDEPRRRMVLARDRFGVKPLYYARLGPKDLVFASEVKALFAHPTVQRSLNSARLAEYLMFRTVAGEETLFENIYELAPGTIMVLQDGQTRSIRYWSPELNLSNDESLPSIVERGNELLENAIEARLVSDVPLGTITSGGLDSSLVSAIAACHVDHPIDTFCVGFADPNYDERPYARLVSKLIGSSHHEIEVRPDDLEQQIDRLTWANDEPLTHPNSVPMHEIFRVAKDEIGVTVLLTGEGADEVFGGYAWYRSAQQRDALKRLPGLSGLSSALPAIGRFATLKKVLRPEYLIEASAFGSPALVKSLVASENGLSDRRAAFWPNEGTPTLDGLFVYDQNTYLPGLLQRQDRMSMAAGLEAREPFLDHHLVEWANTLSGSVKISKGIRKALLKSLAGRWLPEKIINRRKVGFEMPLGEWLKSGGALAHRVEALRDSKSYASEVMNPGAIQRLVAEHNSGTKNHADILWTLVAFDAWAATFLGATVREEMLPGAESGKSLAPVL